MERLLIKHRVKKIPRTARHLPAGAARTWSSLVTAEFYEAGGGTLAAAIGAAEVQAKRQHCLAEAVPPAGSDAEKKCAAGKFFCSVERTAYAGEPDKNQSIFSAEPMKKTILLTLLAAAFLLAGCSTAKPSPVPAELPKISYQPARQTADRFMTQFLAALNAKDCKKIDSALLSESVAKNMTQDSFRRYSSGLEKHLGKIVKTAYVCDLGNPLYRSFVWKLTLERQPADPKIKPIVADVLFQVQVVRVDNAYKILNFIITR